MNNSSLSLAIVAKNWYEIGAKLHSHWFNKTNTLNISLLAWHLFHTKIVEVALDREFGFSLTAKGIQHLIDIVIRPFSYISKLNQCLLFGNTEKCKPTTLLAIKLYNVNT